MPFIVNIFALKDEFEIQLSFLRSRLKLLIINIYNNKNVRLSYWKVVNPSIYQQITSQMFATP